MSKEELENDISTASGDKTDNDLRKGVIHKPRGQLRGRG